MHFDACSFFFSSRRRHTRLQGDWSSDVCSSDLFESRSTRICLLRHAWRRPAQNNPPCVSDSSLKMHRRLVVFHPKLVVIARDRKSTRLNSSHLVISYAVFCLKKTTYQLPLRYSR